MTEEVKATKMDALWECVCKGGDTIKFDIDLLVEHSGYFSGLMRSDMRETQQRKLNLCLFSADTIAFLFELFVYRNRIQTIQELEATFKGHFAFPNLEELLRLIDYLDIPCLIPKCCVMLNALIPTYCSGIRRLWQMWELSNTYSLESVEEELASFLVKNIKGLQAMDCLFIKELPMELLLGMLAKDSLEVKTEQHVMSIIESWILYHPSDRLQYFDDLFKCIHVPSLIHSEFKEIDTRVDKLTGKKVNLRKTYSSYIGNPHKFFVDVPHMKKVRNGQDIIISLGGIYEHSVRNYELNLTNRNHRNGIACLPMFYSEIEMLENYKNSEFVELDDVNRGEKRVSCHRNSRTELNMKQFPSLKSPVRLVEFGLCLYDGFVYIMGGQRQMNDMAMFSVKGGLRLDPNCGEWQEVNCMRDGRCLFCLCAVWDRIYAVGGANQYGILQSTEYYLPLEDKWNPGPDLPTALLEHAGCVLHDCIYISGGFDGTEITDKARYLDSVTGSWKPAAPLLRSRSYHAMATVGEKIYVVGGCSKEHDIKEDVYSVEEYDPRIDTWTQILQLNCPISDCLPVILDHKILFIGAYSFNEKVYLQQMVTIDTEKQQWRVSELTFLSKSKKIVGYACIKCKIKKRFLMS